MDTESGIRGFRNSLLRRGKSTATAEAYCQDARNFLRFLQKHRTPLEDSGLVMLQHYQEHLEACHGKINSIRRSVIGIRQFFRHLTEIGLLKHSPPDALTIPPRDERLDPPLKGEDLLALIDHTRRQHPRLKGLRNAVILLLLGAEGLKVSELTALRWNDYIRQRGPGSLRISGKRNRIIQLHPETNDALKAYQKEFAACLSSPEEKQQFIYMILAYTGRDTGHPVPSIGRHGLKFLLSELAPAAHKDRLNTEMLRHYAIRSQLEAGKTPEEIMQHLGLKRPGNILKHLRQRKKKQPARTEKASEICTT